MSDPNNPGPPGFSLPPEAADGSPPPMPPPPSEPGPPPQPDPHPQTDPAYQSGPPQQPYPAPRQHAPAPGAPHVAPRRSGLTTVVVVVSLLAVVCLTGAVALVVTRGFGGLGLGSGASTAELKDYRDRSDLLTSNHKDGHIDYKVTPPVGGDHSAIWQNCDGVVYDAEIPDEHAVHSLEHGTVWITYRPGLPKDQIETLAAKVRKRAYLMMSPYPKLDKPVTLQAWGLQLRAGNADDPAIDEFIDEHRGNGPEKGASCTSGVSKTGSDPA